MIVSVRVGYDRKTEIKSFTACIIFFVFQHPEACQEHVRFKCRGQTGIGRKKGKSWRNLCQEFTFYITKSCPFRYSNDLFNERAQLWMRWLDLQIWAREEFLISMFISWVKGLNGQVVEWVDVDEDWMATNPQITRFLEFFATTPPQLCEADEIDRIN